MKTVIYILEIVILSLFGYGYLKRRQIYKEKKILWKQLVPKGRNQVLYCSCVLLAMTALVLMLELFYHRDSIFITKRLVVLGMLFPIAACDYREFRIPNMLILSGLACRVLILIAEIFLTRDILVETVVKEGIAIIGSVAVCLVCVILSRGSLGMGDIKLMIMMSALLGIEGICYGMFVSVFFAFIVSIILLITKRKKKKDAIPFAPFILAGTFTCLILSGV